MTRRRRAGGFTLVETLVAVAIFALIGAAAYQVLSSVMNGDERLAARSAEQRALNRALSQLQADFEQLVRRPVREQGAVAEWLEVEPEAELPLRLTRGGRANPLQLPRSAMQRVAYAVAVHPERDETESRWYGDQRTHLLRYSWPALDGAHTADDALVQVVLEDVEAMAVTVQGARGASRQWPPASDPAAQPDVPRAVAVELQHAQLGALRRLFRVF